MDALIVVSRQFDFTQKSKGKFCFTKNIGSIGEKRRNHRINGWIAINGRDDTPFDQIVVIKS